MSIALANDDEADDAIIRIWQRLARLRWLSLTAEPGPESSTGWRGSGSGRINVNAVGDDWRLVERGRFSPAGAAHSLSFKNVYRWQRTGDRLRLYHERFGAQAAVFLFELVAASRERLVCAQPHRCGDDSYRGALVLTGAGFNFDWSITGPRKDEHLFYRYRT